MLKKLSLLSLVLTFALHVEAGKQKFTGRKISVHDFLDFRDEANASTQRRGSLPSPEQLALQPNVQAKEEAPAASSSTPIPTEAQPVVETKTVVENQPSVPEAAAIVATTLASVTEQDIVPQPNVTAESQIGTIEPVVETVTIQEDLFGNLFELDIQPATDSTPVSQEVPAQDQPAPVIEVPATVESVSDSLPAANPTTVADNAVEQNPVVVEQPVVGQAGTRATSGDFSDKASLVADSLNEIKGESNPQQPNNNQQSTETKGTTPTTASKNSSADNSKKSFNLNSIFGKFNKDGWRSRVMVATGLTLGIGGAVSFVQWIKATVLRKDLARDKQEKDILSEEEQAEIEERYAELVEALDAQMATQENLGVEESRIA